MSGFHLTVALRASVIMAFAVFLQIFFHGTDLKSAEPSHERTKNRFNVVVVVINSLRADHLGIYGYSKGITPNIDRFGREGIVFTRAIGQSYWTLPSMVSLLTSQYVRAHRVDARNKKMLDEHVTLPGILRNNGYTTAAFTCGLDLAGIYGFDKDFNSYYAYEGKSPVGRFRDIWPRITRWLRQHKQGPFFLLIHSYDTHPPYFEHEKTQPANKYGGFFLRKTLEYNLLRKIKNEMIEYDQRSVKLYGTDIEYIRAQYDAAIEEVDGYIGKLQTLLKDLRLDANTLVVLCADHGEELGERGTFDRYGNRNLYQEVIRVPLMIRYPGVAFSGIKEEALVGLIDVAPTILKSMSLPIPDSFQGISLFSCLQKEPRCVSRDFVVAEADARTRALIDRRGWKIIVSPAQTMLFDLNEDSGETKNILNEPMRFSLMSEFMKWVLDTRRTTRQNNTIILDSGIISRLRKAGYW